MNEDYAWVRLSNALHAGYPSIAIRVAEGLIVGESDMPRSGITGTTLPRVEGLFEIALHLPDTTPDVVLEALGHWAGAECISVLKARQTLEAIGTIRMIGGSLAAVELANIAATYHADLAIPALQALLDLAAVERSPHAIYAPLSLLPPERLPLLTVDEELLVRELQAAVARPDVWAIATDTFNVVLATIALSGRDTHPSSTTSASP